jgi:hypothetical protein
MRTRIVAPRRFAIVVLLSVLSVGISPCFSQTVTTWIESGSGDWFDSQNWDNGIPNSAGVVARLTGTTSNSIQLAHQATVGQLIFMGPQQTSVLGSGPLLFDRPGGEAALIRLTPSASRGAINSPISIASGEQLSIDVAQFTSLTLGGGIISSAGDILKNGLGTLTLFKSPGTTPGDLNLWRANFGETAGSASVADGTIPEPSTAGLLFVAIFTVLRWRRVV